MTLDLMTILTEQTCGEACWSARDDICRCSCGGKNHGCLRNENGQRPERTSRIDGDMYILKAVGNDLYNEADKINKVAGARLIDPPYTYDWRETDKHAPARIKTASKSQCNCWPELSAWRNQTDTERYFNTPYCLWVKVS